MEISSQDIKYNIEFDDIDLKRDRFSLPEYEGEVYEKIKTALDINEEGYNVYLIDDFSKIKLENIREYISEILKDRDRPKDICYAVKEDENNPFPIYVSNGRGHILKEAIEDIQDNYYKIIYDFYNSSTNKEKEKIIENIQKKRNELVTELMDSAHNYGFEIRSTSKGFTFIPVKNEEAMTEKEYDSLETEKKEEILGKVSELKLKSIKILEKLKEIEIVEIEKIKRIMIDYFDIECKEIKDKYEQFFCDDPDAVKFINDMCNEIEEDIVENYSIVYEDDEEKINEIINRYEIKILVDNSKNVYPQVIFEEDPNVINLLGSIDYKNQNGTYVTDMSLIKSGSILKANEGCLIIRINNLLSNPTAYYNLKKTLISGKINFNYNKGYVELFSLSSLDPEPINVNLKIIMIGDYETYDILYNYDEDFKKIFKIKAQFNPIVAINQNTKGSLVKNIVDICNANGLKSLDSSAMKEVAKFMSRKAEDRNKLLIDNEELSKILLLSNNKVEREKRDKITGEDIIGVAYSEDIIEREIREYYEENKILLDVKNKKVGQINGLSVIDAGYTSFGKPIRITCSCYKGEGEIIDVQKQSDLSGNIHSKAVNILKGFISELLGKYSKIPINFHLSFEQVYGKVDGDSASVAELIAMISSLSNIPIKQNIAVTGSINQFGEIQPIGGVNEKIEGFFKVCKCTDGFENKGVLIPFSNKNDLVLSSEVEKAIEEGKFHIYAMKNVRDAAKVLMANYEEVIYAIKRELKKYNKKII